MTESTPLRIGTRGSKLALAQTNMVIARLREAHEELTERRAVELIVIKTTGDRVSGELLTEMGGKGLFSKELDEALLKGEIDIGIHSMKDLPTWMPDGIALHAIMERQDARDAFVSDKADSLATLPPASTVGTMSLRRRAQILHKYPQLQVVPIKGNVDTRLNLVRTGAIDATLLAVAGLNRLGQQADITQALDPEEILPAVGQGALAATCRTHDLRSNHLISALADPTTTATVIAERAMLNALNGNCYTPVAGYAVVDGNGQLTIKGVLAHPDGNEYHSGVRSGGVDEAEALGRGLGIELLEKGGTILMDAPKAVEKQVIHKHPEMREET
ncbi:MAG: hydroxymethylbilane synthase [Proteobacteria bacterium]|nr:hydroxymethylbilane synthase [Pseudomonadota bacterium]